ncbi:MAG TPA: 50S ribosomal protein L1 [Acidimicrobiales bacterium]|nr:50S ribosomal protein L1 [Acidimicrobiales bacterium]
MTPPGKRYRDAARRFDPDLLHGPAEAVELAKSLATARFDETIEVAVQLGVDPRKPDQQVRGTVSLPAGTGKAVRVAVFATGEAAAEAREAGADLVGADDLIAQVGEGMLDFDVAIATPDQMAQVARLGRILGPRGLMPNPKTGTVTTEVGKAVSEFKAGRVEYRTERQGANVHVPIGRASFTTSALVENFAALVDELHRAKPAASKGRYLRRVSVSSTMGPGIKIDPARLPEIASAVPA